MLISTENPGRFRLSCAIRKNRDFLPISLDFTLEEW